jgi:hypothetical protein
VSGIKSIPDSAAPQVSSGQVSGFALAQIETDLIRLFWMANMADRNAGFCLFGAL